MPAGGGGPASILPINPAAAFLYDVAMAARTYLLLALALGVGARAEAPPPLAVLSNTQVTDTLYETLNWYRALPSQSASSGGDALILYANRQIATQVVHLTLDMARSDAELLSSQESQAQSTPSGTSADALNAQRAKLDAQAKQIQSELQSTRATSTSTRAQSNYASAKLSLRASG